MYPAASFMIIINIIIIIFVCILTAKSSQSGFRFYILPFSSLKEIVEWFVSWKGLLIKQKHSLGKTKSNVVQRVLLCKVFTQRTGNWSAESSHNFNPVIVGLLGFLRLVSCVDMSTHTSNYFCLFIDTIMLVSLASICWNSKWACFITCWYSTLGRRWRIELLQYKQIGQHSTSYLKWTNAA